MPLPRTDLGNGIVETYFGKLSALPAAYSTPQSEALTAYLRSIGTKTKGKESVPLGTIDALLKGVPQKAQKAVALFVEMGRYSRGVIAMPATSALELVKDNYWISESEEIVSGSKGGIPTFDRNTVPPILKRASGLTSNDIDYAQVFGYVQFQLVVPSSPSQLYGKKNFRILELNPAKFIKT